MLTVKQPASYGYKSVHDLPTPPATSRPSPPLAEPPYRHTPSLRRSQSPASQPMSTHHRGLPPPAAMTLPPQQQQQQQQHQHQHQPPPPQQQQQQQPPPPPPSTGPPPPSHHHHGHHPPPPPPPPPQGHLHQAGQPWSSLPAPPSQWQGAEDSMRNWLQTRAEEEKTRQEEEKTKQENLRLEQRRIEADILRASLTGGIPPPMVPIVFAGMGSGGTLPQAALEWAQQFMPPQQGHQLQLMAPQGPVSPHHTRDHSGHAHPQYAGAAPAQPTPQAQGPYSQHPGSPGRARAQTAVGGMAHPMAGGSNLPSLNTNVPHGAAPPQHQPHPQLQGHAAQQEASPSIYFHHWQPPSSQAAGGSSNRPGTPSGDTPSRKRKATGPQPSALPGGEQQQARSPPPFVSPSSSSNQPPIRRGHKRQRSDVSWYRLQDRGEDSDRSTRDKSPARAPLTTAPRERSRSEVGKHSVSSLLSADPADQLPGAPQSATEARSQSWHAGPSTLYRSVREEHRGQPASPTGSSQKGRET